MKTMEQPTIRLSDLRTPLTILIVVGALLAAALNWDALILNPLINLLLVLYQLLFKDFALTIIVFTILVRLLTFPLTYQQQKASKKMTEFQQSDAWKKIQEKHAGEREKLAQEQMRLMQEAGVNPLGGCLPLLIQLPVLFGLYQALNQAMATSPLQLFELSRHLYPFLPNVAGLIPLNNKLLWINLGLPDPLFVIPALAVLTTWIQSRIMPTPPSADPNAASMTQSMAFTSTLMVGMFSMQVASGLSLYWIVGNIFGIVQQALTSKVEWRNIFSLGLSAPPPPPEPTTKRKKKKKRNE
jgi:YidC/Oxa1 family membrane protein insertase